MKHKKWLLSLFLIIFGISIFLYPKISNHLEEKRQAEIIKNYKETITHTEEETIHKEYEIAKTYNENLSKTSFPYTNDQKTTYENILNLSQDGIMSYIEIPKISCFLPIYHGTNDQVMKKGVGHLESTSLPIGGENTHCVLTGHSGLLSAEIFTRLRELKVDDYFYINTLGEKLNYQVKQIKIVLPTETDDLKIIEGKDLVTLVTCTPYGINTHRLLVQGERVGKEDIEDIEAVLEEEVNAEKTESKQKKNNRIWIIYVVIICLIIFSFFMLRKFLREKGLKK